MTAAKRINQFLQNHPTGALQVTVGFSSIWGLAWLNRRTKERRVDLLIGNTSKQYFRHGTREDREEALDFLSREDVTVAEWAKRNEKGYRTIMIAWLIFDGEFHLLAGSAHLSKQCMQINHELMAEASEKEIGASVEKMKKVFRETKDCRKDLISYIDVEEPTHCA